MAATLHADHVPACDSCGRAPALPITVRRHVGLLVLQRFVKGRVVACRPCGRALVRGYTLRTLLQGWWGVFSFFFNWFVLASNAIAWRRLGRIPAPSLSGDPVEHAPWGFFREDGAGVRRRSRGAAVALAVFGGLVVLGAAGRVWDSTHHDHGGAHGNPLSAALLERAMVDGPFLTDAGVPITVSTAICRGDGEPSGGGYTHFRCRLLLPSGPADEVLVHLLAGDELYFKSPPGAG